MAAGWVQLIGEEHEQARVIVALLVSITFEALHLSIKPLTRTEDSMIMHFSELSLVFIYLTVLLIKSCDMSSVSAAYRADAENIARAVCTTYGFGDVPNGLFIFFVFFGLSTVVSLVVIGCARLWVEGYLPKILLVARAHSMPPSMIVQR